MLQIFCYESKRHLLFTIIVFQEVTTDEPVSCLCYTPDFVLMGMDTVYKLSIRTGSIRPFLDANVKPSTNYNSFPINILSVNSEDKPPEYLCCFSGQSLTTMSSPVKHHQSIKISPL